MSQHDIGFNTGLKRWFVQGFTQTRGQLLQMNHIEDSNLKIKNVMCDTYAWSDPQNPLMTHGRLRYYQDNNQEIKARGNVADSVTVTGDESPFKFQKFLKVKPIIKYQIPTMEWKLVIDGNDYITKGITGKISGYANKEHIWFMLEECDVWFSSIITLINPEVGN